jgi:hypothetical protein
MSTIHVRSQRKGVCRLLLRMARQLVSIDHASSFFFKLRPSKEKNMTTTVTAARMGRVMMQTAKEICSAVVKWDVAGGL